MHASWLKFNLVFSRPPHLPSYTSLRPFLSTRNLTIAVKMDPALPSSSQMYTYEPLEADSIRLMHLEPALHPDAPLPFAFTQGAVSDLVSEYEAISYTWGEPKLDCPICVDNGSRVMVTTNLDKALK